MHSAYKGLIGVAVGFTAWSLSVDGAYAAELTFNKSTVNAPFELTHPIIAADVLPQSGKELIAFGIDGMKQRKMAIYQLVEGEYKLLHQYQLPLAVHSFDITSSTTNGLQQLYFLSQDELLLMQPQPIDTSLNLVSVAQINSLSFKERPDFISRGEFVKDLNGDSQDDILIHDFTQAHLFLATEQGFNRQTLPIKPQSRLFEDGATYTQSIVYISDFDLDGLADIVKIGEGELEVYKQTDAKGFDPVAQYVSVSQPISGIDWWNKRDAYGEPLDQSELIYRKVEHLKDLNDDGISDMVIRYTKSTSVFDRVNDYEIYLGEPKEGRISFPKTPSSVVRAEGTLTGLEFVDIDSDNKDEVLVAGFDIGVSQVVGAILSGSIAQDVHLFKMDANSRYSDKSNVTKEVELNFSLSSGQSGNPVVKLADLNGDGLKDLLLSEDESTLRIYLGKAGNGLFSRKAQEHELQLPTDGEMIMVEDLNDDGREDLLIKYGRQDDKSLANQFRVFFAG